MAVMRPRMCYSDLQGEPEDGPRYELYDGEVSVVPAPVPRHQLAAQEIEALFRAYRRTHGGLVLLSPIDIVFSEFDVIQPDVVFFSRARAHLVRPDEPIRDVPDLVVEVLSPSTASTDRGRKMQTLARHGLPEYWLVDPRAKTIEIYQLVDADYGLVQSASSTDVVSAQTLPDLRFPAQAVFGDW